MSESIRVEKIVLGTMILKFNLPMEFVDRINEVCDASEKISFNYHLAGKIRKEFNITSSLPDDIKIVFLGFFQEYMRQCTGWRWQSGSYCYLDQVWYNDMKSGEYNPPHVHNSTKGSEGLSSVLMLKRPKTYGKEFSQEENPSNGHLSLICGMQDSFAASMCQTDMQVGDFFVFPYSLVHSVNPFNGTKEVRRTLSYNCNIFKNKDLTNLSEGSNI